MFLGSEVNDFFQRFKELLQGFGEKRLAEKSLTSPPRQQGILVTRWKNPSLAWRAGRNSFWCSEFRNGGGDISGPHEGFTHEYRSDVVGLQILDI